MNFINFILFIGGIGATEIIIILLIVLLLFGGRKIPELMRGLGKGMREFKDAQKDEPAENDDSNEKKETKKNVDLE